MGERRGQGLAGRMRQAGGDERRAAARAAAPQLSRGPLGDAVLVLCNDSEAHEECEGSIERLIDVERDADAENEAEGEERVLALSDFSAEPLGVEDGDAE